MYIYRKKVLEYIRENNDDVKYEKQIRGKVLIEGEMVIHFTQPNCASFLFISFIITQIHRIAIPKKYCNVLSIASSILRFARPLIFPCILFHFITSLGKQNHSSFKYFKHVIAQIFDFK